MTYHMSDKNTGFFFILPIFPSSPDFSTDSSIRIIWLFLEYRKMERFARKYVSDFCNVAEVWIANDHSDCSFHFDNLFLTVSASSL